MLKLWWFYSNSTPIISTPQFEAGTTHIIIWCKYMCRIYRCLLHSYIFTHIYILYIHIYCIYLLTYLMMCVPHCADIHFLSPSVTGISHPSFHQTWLPQVECLGLHRRHDNGVDAIFRAMSLKRKHNSTWKNRHEWIICGWKPFKFRGSEPTWNRSMSMLEIIWYGTRACWTGRSSGGEFHFVS